MTSGLIIEGHELEVQEYCILHLVVRSQGRVGEKNSLFLLEGQQLKVEVFARKVLERSGYRVFLGEDAHFFFGVLSFNFEDSFFLKTYQNWVGGRGANAGIILAELKRAVSKCLADSRLSGELLDKAANAVREYYAFPPKSEIHSQLDRVIRRLDPETVLRAIRFYRETGYTTKGVPDLFVAKDSSLFG